MDIEVKENFNIKKLTAFKIGGNIDKAFFPKSEEEFVFLLSEIEAPLILGNCSNILFSSFGYKGNVILTTKMNNFLINKNKIKADCGVKGALLANEAFNNSLSGFEFMIGFPGSIGGNVYMNAGAHGQSISDTCVSAKIYDISDKKIITLTNSELNFEYRKSVLQNHDYIVLSAEFELNPKPQSEIKNLMDENLKFRQNVQPSMKNPNAGSVFRNPENNSAGKLLELSGAKNFTEGDASVWGKHANFIINTSEATSLDVLNLMTKMVDCVYEKQGVKLIPEIKYVGNKNNSEDKLCQKLYQTKI